MEYYSAKQKYRRGHLTNASTPTTPLSQFVPFAALSQAQIAPIAARPVLRVKRMLGGRFALEENQDLLISNIKKYT